MAHSLETKNQPAIWVEVVTQEYVQSLNINEWGTAGQPRVVRATYLSLTKPDGITRINLRPGDTFAADQLQSMGTVFGFKLLSHNSTLVPRGPFGVQPTPESNNIPQGVCFHLVSSYLFEATNHATFLLEAAPPKLPTYLKGDAGTIKPFTAVGDVIEAYIRWAAVGTVWLQGHDYDLKVVLKSGVWSNPGEIFGPGSWERFIIRILAVQDPSTFVVSILSEDGREGKRWYLTGEPDGKQNWRQPESGGVGDWQKYTLQLVQAPSTYTICSWNGWLIKCDGVPRVAEEPQKPSESQKPGEPKNPAPTAETSTAKNAGSRDVDIHLQWTIVPRMGH